MGQICPICQSHQAQVQLLTTHQGKTNAHSRDVIGVRLACGHDIYGKEASEFQKSVNEIEQAYAVKLADLDKERRESISKAAIAVRAKVAGGARK